MNETSQADTDFYWMQERALRAEEQVEKLQEALRLYESVLEQVANMADEALEDGQHVAVPLPEKPRKEA